MERAETEVDLSGDCGCEQTWEEVKEIRRHVPAEGQRLRSRQVGDSLGLEVRV